MIRPRALISVSDKSNIIDFATSLSDLGWEIISTGGTYKILLSAGIKVVPINNVTGFPELFEGRVKTLHPSIHGGILYRRENTNDLLELERSRIRSIDLVCVNLYPFEEILRSNKNDEKLLIENIDIGGPTMIRSAAKNFSDVSIITNIFQYQKTIENMSKNNGNTTLEFRRELAKEAFKKTFEYEKAISSWINNTNSNIENTQQNSIALRYGENPHQEGRLELKDKSSVSSIAYSTNLSKEPVSYNNLLDSDAALQCCLDIYSMQKSPCAVVVKHLNPCGASIATSPSNALEQALEGDPLAAFGGILACSHPINEEEALLLTSKANFLEVITAPSFSSSAEELLTKKWKRIRLLDYGPISSSRCSKEQKRSITDGYLIQEQDTSIPEVNKWVHKAGPIPSPEILQSARFGFICSKHLKSNAISIVNGTQMIGAGMGQVDRLNACAIAIEKSKNKLKEAIHPIASSDAFFPFSDGPKILIENGIKTIVQPGGSKRDEETITLCKESNITLLFTGIRTFRH